MIHAALPASAAPRPAPRALFLHGAGAWGGQWAIWRRVFEAEGWRTAAPDRRPSAAGLAATRLEDHVAQSVEAFDAIARLSPDDVSDDHGAPVVIGASLGGLLALAVAARRSSAAHGRGPRALVLVNPLPPAPWITQLMPVAIDGDVVPWHSQGRFASTARAVPAASFADRQHAFRQWRDESAVLLREARVGIDLSRPDIPILVIASDADTDVPSAVSAAFASDVGAGFVRVPGGHVDPVMGASAAAAARLALGWINAMPATRLSAP